MTNLSQAQWRKATRSNGANGSCVEIADNLPGVVAVRDSKFPHGGVHILSKASFAAFLVDVKTGRYDQ